MTVPAGASDRPGVDSSCAPRQACSFPARPVACSDRCLPSLWLGGWGRASREGPRGAGTVVTLSPVRESGRDGTGRPGPLIQLPAPYRSNVLVMGAHSPGSGIARRARSVPSTAPPRSTSCTCPRAGASNTAGRDSSTGAPLSWISAPGVACTARGPTKPASQQPSLPSRPRAPLVMSPAAHLASILGADVGAAGLSVLPRLPGSPAQPWQPRQACRSLSTPRQHLGFLPPSLFTRSLLGRDWST